LCFCESFRERAMNGWKRISGAEKAKKPLERDFFE
jgi:hypothetical protein